MAKRGRPTKEPTAEVRAKVKSLLAKKVPIEDLAKMFGLSKPTFRKYFRSEIWSERKIGAGGKPRREVTAAHREKVSLYLGYGLAPEDIALALGYVGDDDFHEFKTSFSLELKIGKAKTRCEIVDRLNEQSKAGVIGATNKLEALSRASSLSESPSTPSAAYVGKKEAAKVDAATAVAGGGKFAPRTAPRLIASGGRQVDGE